ncbi:MAG: 23S rRNA (uracil(1939)-C(5))-methyltransferase RlmD [Litorivicinaceae bacterium]
MSASRQGRRGRRAPVPEFPIRIDRLSHEGRGIAQWGPRTLFVGGALPGELVQVKVLTKNAQVAEGIATDVFEASPERITPLCPHAGHCGGCALQHVGAEQQIAMKTEALHALMARHGVELTSVTHLPPILGPTLGYRRRARLGVRWVRAKGRVLVGFRERASNFIADVSDCPVLDARVGPHLQRLANVIANSSQVDQIPQVEVAAGDDTVAIVIRHLAPLTAADQQGFLELGQGTGWHVYTQAKGPESITRLWPSDGPTALTYRIGELGLEYRFEVTDFTQINAGINRAMVLQALSLLQLTQEDHVLDLFSGLGNFTLAAATQAGSVTAVEVSPTMVSRCLQNAQHNGLTNVHASACDLTAPIADQDWARARYSVLIVDPPRSGAREVLEALPLNGVERLLYVSCNPATLGRDAAILATRGFRMTHLGMMDMFPQTAHVESMACFTRGSRG